MLKKKVPQYTGLLICLFLLGVGVWRLGAIPLEIAVAMQITSVTMLGFIIMRYKPKMPLLFKRQIIFIFIAVGCSMITCSIYRDQDIFSTFIAQRYMYFYLVYFALAALNVPSVQVERALKYVAVFFACMYFLQYLVYPAIVFYWPKVQIERATFRFRVDGFELLIFLAAYSFNKILQKKAFYFPILVLSVLVNLLSGQRFLLLITALCIGLVGYKSKAVSTWMKIFVIILFAVSIVLLMPEKYVTSITATTQKDLSEGDDYIRLPAAYYYATTYNTNLPTWIFGNGVEDAHSVYGLQVATIADNFRFYLSDIGFIGEFVRFGIFYLIIVIVLLARAIKISRRADPIINSYLIVITIMYIVDWPFGHGPGIILLSSLLYIVNKKIYENKIILKLDKDRKNKEIDNKAMPLLEPTT